MKTPTGPVLRSLGIEPLRLRFKEGLALINGTSAMTGVGSLLAEHALAQARHAEIVAALVSGGSEISPVRPAAMRSASGRTNRRYAGTTRRVAVLSSLPMVTS